jgi:hypothetical protein
MLSKVILFYVRCSGGELEGYCGVPCGGETGGGALGDQVCWASW